MSALGSSVINKSGKKFAPKVPSRRPVAPTSTQASSRPSVDRQAQSETPQTQSLQQQDVATSTSPQLLPTPASSQQETVPPIEKPTRKDETVQNPEPSPSTVTLEKYSEPADSTVIAVPSQSIPIQKRTSSRSVVSLHSQQKADSRETSQPIESPRDLGHAASPLLSTTTIVASSNLSSSPQPRRSPSVHRDPTSIAAPNAASFLEVGTLQEDVRAPATKRRKLVGSAPDVIDMQPPAAEPGANVPIPTTEPDTVAIEISENIEPGPRTVTAVDSVAVQSSQQAKRKKHTENAAANVIADKARPASSKTTKPRKATKGKITRKIGEEHTITAAGPSTETEDQGDQGADSARPKRKSARRKIKPTVADAAAEIVEDAVAGANNEAKKRGRKSKREVTPEGADKVIISPSTTKMSELCKDNRTGRKSNLERDIEKFERAKFLEKKQQELQQLMGQEQAENGTGQSESTEQRLDRLSRQRQREESVANNVPNTIIVNGQIQIDEDSLQIDRHARANAEREVEQLEAVDETDLSRKVNSSSWLKRDKSGGWNELLTERFYDGLRMFGTDFEMISKMFPGRTRHKIKLKFVREEKVNLDKIKATLLGQPLPVDLPELERMAGVEFDDPKELERDMEEDRMRLEEETLAEKRAMDEAREEREAQIARERAAAGDESSAKENRRGKGKRKKGEKRTGRRKEKGGKASAGAQEALGEIGGEMGVS